ncbi:nicotinate-nucleotide adenylyltransferase [cyanobiont of Ornithocercus magnificus]|nr:nicotinate-nucleotide adenylyltransferase [cyanobiont of Ornithocercus magnificus]
MIGNLALFGTSADPPTWGHQALLEGLLRLYPQVITWASNNPTKHHSAQLDHRVELLEALVDSIASPRLKLHQSLSSPWTTVTVNRAVTRWPNADLVVVIGSDLAGQLPHWKQAKDVLRQSRLAIAPRAGWPLRSSELEAIKRLGGKLDLLSLKIPASASSDVRHNLALDKVPYAVRRLLLKHNLYGIASSF